MAAAGTDVIIPPPPPLPPHPPRPHPPPQENSPRDAENKQVNTRVLVCAPPTIWLRYAYYMDTKKRQYAYYFVTLRLL